MEYLIGATVVKVDDSSIEFSNGIKLEVEDIEYHVNIGNYKEDSE